LQVALTTNGGGETPLSPSHLFIEVNVMRSRRGKKDPVYHFVYLIRNKINGKIYVGKHSSHTKSDPYLGSGTIISDAIKLYGRENFERIILHEALSDEHAYELEKMIVDDWFISRTDTYNQIPGGSGFRSGENNPNYQGKITNQPQIRERMKPFIKGSTPHNKKFYNLTDPNGNEYLINDLIQWCTHLTLSPKHLLAHLGSVVPKIEIPLGLHKPNSVQRLMNTEGWLLSELYDAPNQFSPLPEKTQGKNIRITNKLYILTSPDGKEFKTADLWDFCNEHLLSPKQLLANKGTVVPPINISPGLKKKDSIRRLSSTPGWSLRIESSVIIST